MRERGWRSCAGSQIRRKEAYHELAKLQLIYCTELVLSTTQKHTQHRIMPHNKPVRSGSSSSSLLSLFSSSCSYLPPSRRVIQPISRVVVVISDVVIINEETFYNSVRARFFSSAAKHIHTAEHNAEREREI